MKQPSRPPPVTTTLLPTVIIASLLVSAGCQDARPGPLSDENYPPKGMYLQVDPPVALIANTGEQIQLTATVLDAFGKPIQNPKIAWSSLTPSVATVDWNGKVTGMTEGLAEIKGTYGSISGTAVVAVAKPRLKGGDGNGSSVVIDPMADTVRVVGSKIKLLAVGRNPAGKLVTNSSLTWKSVRSEVATVDGDGIVTGVLSGESTIVVENGQTADSATVWVAPPDVAALVEITPQTDTIPTIGSSVTLQGRVLNGSGTPLADKTVTWSSLDAGVAVVGPDGEVVGGSKGVARIRAAYQDLADTAQVWVAALASATSLFVEPETDTIPDIGGTVQLTATLLDGNGTPITGQTISWGTMDAAVASVDANGEVTGVSRGVARITARYNTLVDTSTIWVNPTATPTPPLSVVVSPDQDTIPELGQTVALVAMVYDADGIEFPSLLPSWSSLDGSVAGVSTSEPSRDVVVTGLSAGTARVVAAYQEAADTAVIQVADGTATTGASIRITPHADTLAGAGDTTRLQTTVRDAQGNVVQASITWTSLSPTVAKIGDGGLVVALANGIAPIAASYSGMADTATVYVGPQGPQPSVVIAPSADTIPAVGDRIQLGATVKDPQGNVLTGVSVVWSSLDPYVASVDLNGEVTGLWRGLARIRAEYQTASDTALVWVAPGTAPPPGTQLTPPDLLPLLGPTVARNTVVPGWPSHFDPNLDAAINRMVSEVAAGSYSYITDSADQDNPHYGPLRMVTMRNIRAGLPLNETEPGFAAALRITREFIRLYAKPAGYDIQGFRNTNWADCEIVWWLFRNDPGDNGVLAGECRDYLWVASVWLSAHLTTQTANLSHQWMDTRTITLALETAQSADRLGVPYGQQHPTYRTSENWPSGVSDWQGYIEYIAGFVRNVQDETVARFGTMLDPNGKPILPGNVRYGINGNWSSPSDYVEPYPILFFMDAMLANALLRAWREYGCTACRDRAIQLATGVQQHYDSSRHTLPYRSHATSAGRMSYGTDDYVLNNYWVRPLLELYELTGEVWMRQKALELLDASRNADWVWRFKQSQQLASATEPQSAQALLAGIH